MFATPNDRDATPDLVAAAREFIRGEGDRCIVSMSQLLKELDRIGGGFRVSPDMYQLLD